MKLRFFVCVLTFLLCHSLFSNPGNEVLFRDSGSYVNISGDSTFSVNGSTIQNQTLLDLVNNLTEVKR